MQVYITSCVLPAVVSLPLQHQQQWITPRGTASLK